MSSQHVQGCYVITRADPAVDEHVNNTRSGKEAFQGCEFTTKRVYSAVKVL